MSILKILLINIIIILFVSCSSNNNSKKVAEIQKPSELYKQATVSIGKSEYETASNILNQITQLYPLSNEAIQSEIMLAFISYLNMNYEDAIFQFNKLILKYPSHKNLDYVYYMKAMCNYEQVAHEDLDNKYNEYALRDFDQVIKRFPDSEYAKDSYQKIILIKSNIAAKHLSIGRFYADQQKYFAALNRYKIIINEYDMTKFTPEALFRMTEIYYNLGMIKDAKKTASVLSFNYPESKWYKYSYELINENKNKKKYISKILDIF